MTPRAHEPLAAALLLVCFAPLAEAQTKAPAKSVKASVAAAATPAKRPLSHRDYDAWRSIATPTLSRDGRYLAYAYMPQDADGDLVVRDLKTGKEQRYSVGTLPPPPLPDPDANPDVPPPVRNVRITFTADSRHVVSTTYPLKGDTEKAKKERKRPGEMPKGGLVIVDLSTFEGRSVSSVKSVQVPSKNGSWIAYSKESTTPAEPPAARGGGGAGGPGGLSDAPRRDYGTDLIVRDLVSGEERTFPSVLEYAVARDGAALLFAVSSRTESENGVFAVKAGARQEAPIALASGAGRYLKLTWDRDQKRAAFVSDRDDVAAASKAPHFKAYLWDRGSSAATAVVDDKTPGLIGGLVPSNNGQLAFSRDGSRLYVPMAPPSTPRADGADTLTDEKVVVDIWSYKDDLVQPMQRIRAAQERNRTYRGVYEIASRRFVQVADPTMRTVSLSDDGSRSVGFDDAPYRRMVDYDGTYSDVYLIDEGGRRKLVSKQWRGGGGGFGGGGFQWAPGGASAVFFADGHWHALDVASGSIRNLTANVPVKFWNETHDSPGPAGSNGAAGWTKDSASFLANDRYDVWQLFLDGRPARNLTGGEGRRSKTVYRVERTEPVDEDDDERGIDPSKPLTLRGENDETHASGYYRQAFDATGAPVKLLSGDRSYRFVARAREADVLLVTAQRFDEYPDVYTTDSTFKTLTKVTDGAAQMAPFLWGKAELMSFRNTDGVPLQAALYKPANFDPKKKYPMIVYIYEMLSQNVNNFVHPVPRNSVNLSLYTSNGYIVVTPDIVYSLGQPGADALKCVLPAVQAVVDQGFVDEANIGIQGHSWGGYQIAYMLTQTSRFKAAEAGAPVGNMTSAYSGIRWGTGLPRQFQYEKTQSRIGPSLYDAPLTYVANSPNFQIKKVTTPVLILANDADDAVPWYQGIEYFLALRRNGKEAYLFNYNGELHNLQRRHNQKDFAARMMQFFDHFLKGAPRPDWMEKGVAYVDREAAAESFKNSIYRPN